MSAATVSRRARWFVTASVVFLVVWQGALLMGAGRRTSVALGLYGFVLHMVFGKAYSLVPSYFARELAVSRAPAIHFPLTILGTAGLALAPHPSVPAIAGAIGGIAWFVGALIFVAAITWTVRDNLTGAETGTSETNEDRRGIDRFANAFVPIVLGYLLVGGYETAARHVNLPSLVASYPPAITHLLAAGGGGLLVFAVGFRLIPRFLVARPPRYFAWIILPAGAVGPAAIAATLPAGSHLPTAAAVEAVAIVGFAAVYLILFARSDRRRVGFYSVLIGSIAGVFAVGLGLQFALAGTEPGLVRAHLRLNLLGFLGLTIIGLAYQFYPPGVGTFPGASDRTALASIIAVGGGLAVQVAGLALGRPTVERAGVAVSLVGTLAYAFLIVGLFYERHWSGNGQSPRDG